ncbi:MAG: gluconeogenesis factor YvcK family protein [Candidatus Magasanikbacteria bacterium]
MKKKKVVVLGGGNGSAIALVALKQNLQKFDISAVISMSDSGGSSGRLRKELGVLPPGDIMRAVLALSVYDYPILKKIFYRNRFSVSGKLNKHNLGNLFLSLSSQYGGSFLKAIRALEESVEAVGTVYPATLKTNDLVAELINGKVIKTEAKIDRPDYDRDLRIKKVYLEPKVKANPEAIQEILSADYVVLSPGSLYTSLVAVLLPVGIKEAIDKSKAKILFIAGNAYNIDGETGPTKLSEVVTELENYLPHPVDFILYNNHKLNKKEKEYYKKKNWEVIVDDSNKLPNSKIVSFDFSRVDGGLCALSLGKKLKELLI